MAWHAHLTLDFEEISDDAAALNLLLDCPTDADDRSGSGIEDRNLLLSDARNDRLDVSGQNLEGTVVPRTVFSPVQPLGVPLLDDVVVVHPDDTLSVSELLSIIEDASALTSSTAYADCLVVCTTCSMVESAFCKPTHGQ